MGTEHAHAHDVSAAGRNRRPLLIALVLTASYMVAEIIGGIATHSLALISDAAHMATDVLGLGMALAAIYLASRPGPADRTFGLYRLEVLAALANGVLLFGVAGYILYEAVQRFRNPPDILGVPMLVVASIGLAVNLISFRLLREGSKESMNVKGAFLEVLSDLLASVGVIVAAIVVSVSGRPYADPVIAVALGLFILPRTWRLCAQAVHVLMEAAPPGVNLGDVRRHITETEGVVDVHDLHAWTITSGMNVVSAHVVVAPNADQAIVLDCLSECLGDHFNIEHSTFQIERGDRAARERVHP